MAYKWCVVPQCTNTSIKCPEKCFVSVPTDAKRRKYWLRLARRDPNSILSYTNVFMCEDHFDMEKDTTNYMKYKMGFSQKIFLTDAAMPTKFVCQDDRKRRLSEPRFSREVFLKRQRKDLVTECLQSQNEPETQRAETAENLQNTEATIQDVIAIEAEELPKTQEKETITDSSITSTKSVQATIKNTHYRSKGVQTRPLGKSISTSPIKVTTTSRFTSPFKIEPCYQQPSRSGVATSVRRVLVHKEEYSESDISCFESGQSSPYLTTSSSKVTDSDTNENDRMEEKQCLQNTIRLIQKKPMLYIGISKESYFLIHLIHKHTNIKIEHILLCLKKLRKNSTFSELEDNFGLSLSYASKIFLGSLPVISSILKPFIVDLDKTLIKKTLPIAFRQNYFNVSCIIDCLEIDIQKPTKALHQALTWSEYKKGNTVKYLISCTPNGLVNYVSPGFGGRTSDITIVENCSFVDGLQMGTYVLADRGFKHLESMLHDKGIKLLRPPSVKAGFKLTKSEVRQTKIIASLRIHIERVIRRVREFHMLKQHSVINSNFICVIDHILIIVCALINLQDSLIK